MDLEAILMVGPIAYGAVHRLLRHPIFITMDTLI